MARVMGIYGESGTWKTTQIGFAAKWMYEKYGLLTRLATLDNISPIKPYIDAGLILPPINLANAPEVPFALRKIRRGMWPMTSAAGKLEWVDWAKHPESAKVGLLAVDVVTAIADKMMSFLREKQQKIGQEAVTPFEVGDEKFSNNSMGHFGWVQTEIQDFIQAMKAIPCERVILTFHETKAEDADKEPIRGPALVGQKRTDKVPSWIDECIHAERYNVAQSHVVQPGDPKAKKESIDTIGIKVRYFFVSHPDQKFPNVTYPAKPRVPANQIPELMKRFPGGFFEPDTESGLDKYLEVDWQLAQSQGNNLRDWMAKVAKQREDQQVQSAREDVQAAREDPAKVSSAIR